MLDDDEALVRLSANLAYHRTRAGLSIEELAEETSVAADDLIAVEEGKRTLATQGLLQLSRRLGVAFAELFSPPFASPRRRVFLRAADQTVYQQMLPDIARLKEFASTVMDAEGWDTTVITRVREDLGHGVALPSNISKRYKQGWNLAESLRKYLDLGLRPIDDISEVLQDMGVLVIEDSLPNDVDGLTLEVPGNRFAVVIDGDKPAVRKRFSLAHELCHIIVDHIEGNLVSLTSQRDSGVEQRANAFAAKFIMPILPCDRTPVEIPMTVHALAHNYGLSEQAAGILLDHHGYGSGPTIPYEVLGVTPALLPWGAPAASIEMADWLRSDAPGLVSDGIVSSSRMEQLARM